MARQAIPPPSARNPQDLEAPTQTHWGALLTSKALSFAAGATFCLVARVALARKLLSSNPKPLAMLSTVAEGLGLPETFVEISESEPTQVKGKGKATRKDKASSVQRTATEIIIPLTLCNPLDPSRSTTIQAVLDTGCEAPLVISPKVAKILGLKVKKGSEPVILAGGETMQVKACGPVQFGLPGRMTTAEPIIMEGEALLGLPGAELLRLLINTVKKTAKLDPRPRRV